MGRNVQIPKEQILEAALNMLRRDGYASINITKLAQELGCSTQAISWKFGNMGNLRRELADYALQYLNSKMMIEGETPMMAFLKVGLTYADMAFDEPNLIRFLLNDEQQLKAGGGIGYIFARERHTILCKRLSEQLHCSREEAKKFMMTLIIYTQGLISMLLSGTLQLDRETVHGMLKEVGVHYVISLGIPEAAAEKLLQLA